MNVDEMIEELTALRDKLGGDTLVYFQTEAGITLSIASAEVDKDDDIVLIESD